MIGVVLRRIGHVLRDDVLRRWLVERALGRTPRAAPARTHWPPYLARKPLVGPVRLLLPRQMREVAPAEPVIIQLPGVSVEVDPAVPMEIFDKRFDDLETYLAVHRFSWLPLTAGIAPALVDTLWHAWKTRYRTRKSDWAWHPYTTAERAINILDFAARCGLSKSQRDDEEVLHEHASVILEHLEYFGETGTGNHLANNGRGLLHLGRFLGLPEIAEVGREILVQEARRLFGEGGVLREGSTHYHLLLTRTYVEAWLLSRGHEREGVFREIANRTLGALTALCLPGGLPLVGDISPDSPPEYLCGLLPQGNIALGWTGRLSVSDQSAVRTLRDYSQRSGLCLSDGWHRYDREAWSALWFVALAGFPPIPGHAHQDMGGFELHWRGHPLFIDRGRGAYGGPLAQDQAEAGWGHNTLLIDGWDPYPTNRPYYDDAFRSRVAQTPVMLRDGASLSLRHGGYQRIGVGPVTRTWSFNDRCDIHDSVLGTNIRSITRFLHTPWPVSLVGNIALIEHPAGHIRVEGGCPPVCQPTRAWTAYSRGRPATTISFHVRTQLPWSGRIRIEPS